MLDLTAVILTYNEEKNISACIDSINSIASRVVVIDSFSTDDTVVIAKDKGAEIYQHKFEYHARQYNWGVNAANISTKWIFRIDADERLTPESAEELEKLCKKAENGDINGIVVRFKVTFLGKDLRHGGIYPFKKLLVYKNGIGYMEDRKMDEHIVLRKGKVAELKRDSLHCDFKDLTFWIDKHNKYATREMEDYFSFSRSREIAKASDTPAKIKRFIKFKLYYSLPSGLRAFVYYFYRYYIKLGFLDGREGHIFAFLQAYWYRYLVDAKIYEKKHYDKRVRRKKVQYGEDKQNICDFNKKI